MKKTIRFRAHPNGDWMSMGASYIQEDSFTIPEGMELDAPIGRMRWHPDTLIDQRHFSKTEITYDYLTLEEANPPTTEKRILDAETAAGITEDVKNNAVWKKLSGDSTDFDELEIKRQQIKNDVV